MNSESRLRLLFVCVALMGTQAQAADPATYAGVGGVKLLDSGLMAVTGGGPFDREENFEVLQRPDGGYTLLNIITAADGRYRVSARFDLDAAWSSQSAHGVGLYGGKPVAITMRRDGKQVRITVKGDGVDLSPTAVCDPDCFINTSPSATAMFVMTRHYDFKKGGEQEFRWTGQDLDQVRTLSGGKARLVFKEEKEVPRWDGSGFALRHFTFVEALPTPNGGTYTLNFDLWTDDMHRPMGFRVRVPGGSAAGVVGFRKGYEDVKAAATKN